MKARIRKVKKLGNGTYYTENWKISEFLIVNLIYVLTIYPIYLFFRYLMWPLTKWTIKYFMVLPTKLGAIFLLRAKKDNNIAKNENITPNNQTPKKIVI